jgi:hypothetical protein
MQYLFQSTINLRHKFKNWKGGACPGTNITLALPLRINHLITEGQKYISGFYLEKKTETSKGITYCINTKKSVYFYPESNTYPFVNFQEKPKSKKGIMFLSASDYCDVLCFVQTNRMAAIV